MGVPLIASDSLAIPASSPKVSALTMIGLAVYVFAALCYILALKKIPVSIAFPSVAASYAVVAVIAHFLWNEPFGWPQMAGIVLIGSGVLLVNQH